MFKWDLGRFREVKGGDVTWGVWVGIVRYREVYGCIGRYRGYWEV